MTCIGWSLMWLLPGVAGPPQLSQATIDSQRSEYGRVGALGMICSKLSGQRIFGLIHAPDCRSRCSSWTCCGAQYWSPQCRRFESYQNSMYLTMQYCLVERRTRIWMFGGAGYRVVVSPERFAL
jgi:hypothetical protein